MLPALSQQTIRQKHPLQRQAALASVHNQTRAAPFQIRQIRRACPPFPLRRVAALTMYSKEPHMTFRLMDRTKAAG